MNAQLISIFFNVIAPVFALVAIGRVAGPRLGLEARTLSRAAYFLFVPAFIFSTLSNATIDADLAARMIGYTAVVHISVALIGFGIAKALGKSAQMVGAYTLIAVFGNVGNFGFPLIEFHLGDQAVEFAAIYFLAIILISFVISVLAANWHKGGSLVAVLEVFKTPALIAAIPAILLNWYNIPIPIMVERVVGLLGQAMVPVMLLALGVQLANTKSLKIDSDTIIASAIRLIISPALAFALVGFFGLDGLERGAGIMQAAMPAAVLTSIIALEYDLVPDFVTRTVLFSTLASVVTLTLILTVI
ncbi:MAG: putative permease [Cellvibrionaceae bacterium]|jgi:predicted permease